MTYQLFNAKQLLALRRQLHGRNTDFPPAIAPANLLIQRAPNDLMAKAHTNQPNPVLCKHCLHKLHQLQNPDIVVERVVSCCSYIESAIVSLILPSTSGRLTASTQQHSINILQSRIQLIVHHIVFAHVQLRDFDLIFLAHFLHAVVQQLLEQVAVAAVLLFRVADGRVAFKDRNAEG